MTGRVDSSTITDGGMPRQKCTRASGERGEQRTRRAQTGCLAPIVHLSAKKCKLQIQSEAPPSEPPRHALMQLRFSPVLGPICVAFFVACEPVLETSLFSGPPSKRIDPVPIPPYGECPDEDAYDYFVACYPIPAGHVNVVLREAEIGMQHSNQICRDAATRIRTLALNHTDANPTLWLGASNHLPDGGLSKDALVGHAGGQAHYLIVNEFFYAFGAGHINNGGLREIAVYHEGLHPGGYRDEPQGGLPSAQTQAEACMSEENFSTVDRYETGGNGGGGGGTCIEWRRLRSYDGGQTWHLVESWTTGC